MKYKYLLIGNSAGAIGCVEGIRQIDKVGSICIVSDEPHHTYSRPLISYLLYGKTDRERMLYRDRDFYKDNGVDKRLGVRAEKLDARKKIVILQDRAEIKYEKLLVATGSRPFVPHMQGLEKVRKRFSFTTLDDALALEKELTENSRVLVIGAGLIGLKCAEGISDKVSKITVVDLADRILPSILDDKGSVMVQQHIEKHGIEFILSDSVAEFSENTATLKSGKKLEFDILVIAVGVRPNTELVGEAGGKVNRGILTDDKCRTSLKDVFAAGDCTESFDVSSGQEKVLALLPNAYKQGEVAGITMAGGCDADYDDAIPMNAIGFWGMHVVTAGSYEGESRVYETENSYKKLVTRDGVLKGYILIGDIKRAGIYTRLVREQTPLDEIDFELVAENPQLMAFSKETRKTDLAGGRAK